MRGGQGAKAGLLLAAQAPTLSHPTPGQLSIEAKARELYSANGSFCGLAPSQPLLAELGDGEAKGSKKDRAQVLSL